MLICQPALQAKYPEDSHKDLAGIACCMVLAALAKPLPRTLAFFAGVIYTYVANLDKVMATPIMVEMALYAIGGFAFIRCARFGAEPCRVATVASCLRLCCPLARMHACDEGGSSRMLAVEQRLSFRLLVVHHVVASSGLYHVYLF